MISRDKGEIVFNCDNCSEYFTIDSDDFYDTLNALKKTKWQFQKEKDGGWSHYCPTCTEKDDDIKVSDNRTKRT